jgi:uncharacterized protein YndB with AHSA1/START domain
VPIIERTLVKSPPELWELIDSPELMGRWSAELSGIPGVVEVVVVEREPGERLAWKAAEADARVELILAEKGWGTNVSITVTGEAAATRNGSALEDLLDELGSPQRQPFTRT